MRITGGLLLEHSEACELEVAGSRMDKAVSHSLSHGGEKSTTCARTNRCDLRGSITQLVGLGEDATQINAEVQVEVVQGLANEVRVQLPEKLTVNQVSGAMVADWDVAEQRAQSRCSSSPCRRPRDSR